MSNPIVKDPDVNSQKSDAETERDSTESDVESTSETPKSTASSCGSREDEASSKGTDVSVQFKTSEDSVMFSNNVTDGEVNGGICENCRAVERDKGERLKKIAALEERCARLEHANNELQNKLELVGEYLECK